MKRIRSITNKPDTSETPFSSKTNRRSFVLAMTISSLLVMLMAVTVLILFVPAPWGIASSISIAVWVVGVYFVFVEFLVQQKRSDSEVRKAARRLNEASYGEEIKMPEESLTPSFRKLDIAIYQTQLDAYLRLFQGDYLKEKAFLERLKSCLLHLPYPQGALLAFRCKKSDIDSLKKAIKKSLPLCLKGLHSQGLSVFLPMGSNEGEWTKRIHGFLKALSFPVRANLRFLSAYEDGCYEDMLHFSKSEEPLSVLPWANGKKEKALPNHYEIGVVKRIPKLEIIEGDWGDYSEEELEKLCSSIGKACKYYIFNAKFASELKKTSGSFFALPIKSISGIVQGFVSLYNGSGSLVLGIEKEKEIELLLWRLKEKYFPVGATPISTGWAEENIADCSDYESLSMNEIEPIEISYEPKKKPLSGSA